MEKCFIKLDNDFFGEYINIDYISQLHSNGEHFWVVMLNGNTVYLSEKEFKRIKKILNQKTIH